MSQRMALAASGSIETISSSVVSRKYLEYFLVKMESV